MVFAKIPSGIYMSQHGKVFDFRSTTGLKNIPRDYLCNPDSYGKINSPKKVLDSLRQKTNFDEMVAIDLSTGDLLDPFPPKEPSLIYQADPSPFTLMDAQTAKNLRDGLEKLLETD